MIAGLEISRCGCGLARMLMRRLRRRFDRWGSKTRCLGLLGCEHGLRIVADRLLLGLRFSLRVGDMR